MSFGEKNGVWKTSTFPLLTASRSALTIDELSTVVAPKVVEWDDMSEPLADVLRMLSVPPAYPGSSMKRVSRYRPNNECFVPV
jgi:hypothetical protein